MPRQSRYIYEFGPFRLDPAERMLTRGDDVLSLTPKALDTLQALVENSRHVVAKEELMNRVWPDIFVEETNLAQHISMLRKVLGERPDGGQYIETVPKRGYRFAVPVRKSFVRKEVALFKGRAIELTEDRLLAVFDGPARAIRAACAISDSARRLGIRLQSGLHTGECHVTDDQVSGVAIEIAAQVAAESSVGEVLVSSTVKDLVAGSGIRFAERGAQVLKGNLGEWRLFAVERGAAI